MELVKYANQICCLLFDLSYQGRHAMSSSLNVDLLNENKLGFGCKIIRERVTILQV